MNKQEFYDEVMLRVASSLPPSFGTAGMQIREVSSFNDAGYTALLIQRDDEKITPSINLDQFYKLHEAGKLSMEDITREIVGIKMQDTLALESMNLERLRDYDHAKDYIEIRLCDRDFNAEHLTNVVSKDFGDYTATYRVNLSVHEEGVFTASITQDVLNSWGVDLEQIHQQAMSNQKPVFSNLADVLNSMMMGEAPTNLFESPEKAHSDLFGEIPMFIVSNESKMNGAAVILNQDLMKQACEIIGGDAFILPSSIHEAILVPDVEEVRVEDLLMMVGEVNETEVDAREILSNKVQHLDKESGSFQNALEWQKQLDRKKDIGQSL